MLFVWEFFRFFKILDHPADTSAVVRDWLTDWRQGVSEGLWSRFESSTFAGSRGSALRCYHLVRTKHTFSPVVCLNLSFHSWDKWIFKFETKNWDVNIFRESGLSTISNLPDPNPFHQSWYQNTNKNQTPKKSSKHKIRRFLVRSCRLITQKSQNTIIVWIKMPETNYPGMSLLSIFHSLKKISHCV